MKRSPRELEHELSQLKNTAGGDPAALEDVRVEWRDAAPEERPDGMTWRPPTDDDPALLAYDVWRAQRETLDTVESGEHDIVAFLAGYGSGKSVFGARWLLTQALEHPGSRFLAMGVDFQKARDTTYPKLFAQLPGDRTTLTTSGFNGPESSPLVADYNRQQHRLTLANDSVITLGSADKYSRYAGAEFGAVWMDEPSHYGDELHDLTGMVTTRLRGVDGPKTQLWTLTGEGYNAAWEILEKRQDADGEDIGLDIDVVTASVLENPYLTEGDKERFKRKYEGTAKEQQALHGGFAAASGLVYSNFNRETHVIPHEEASERVVDDWRVYGYDAGWNDPRVLLEVGKTPYEQLVVLDEFYQSNSHVADAIAWLKRNDKPDGTIYAEHEPAEINKFKRAGATVKKAEKSIDAGISEVRKRLEPDGNSPATASSGAPPVLSWEESREKQQSREETVEQNPRVGLLISDRCQHTIREFLGYKEDHVGKGHADDHCLDGLRYLVMGVAGGSTLVRRKARVNVRKGAMLPEDRR
jgi:phage terminase large subunit